MPNVFLFPPKLSGNGEYRHQLHSFSYVFKLTVFNVSSVSDMELYL